MWPPQSWQRVEVEVEVTVQQVPALAFETHGPGDPDLEDVADPLHDLWTRTRSMDLPVQQHSDHNSNQGSCHGLIVTGASCRELQELLRLQSDCVIPYRPQQTGTDCMPGKYVRREKAGRGSGRDFLLNKIRGAVETKLKDGFSSWVISSGVWGKRRWAVGTSLRERLSCCRLTSGRHRTERGTCESSPLLSVHTCSSWASSGMTRKVLQPCLFFDFRMSPKMWSPMYTMSFPLAPSRSHTMSDDPGAAVVGTGEVEECVEDVEAIHVTTLDELVRPSRHRAAGGGARAAGGGAGLGEAGPTYLVGNVGSYTKLDSSS
ncbi:hypothetical protein CRUP_005651, partial [Coryphaenoides rupestris]